MRFHVSILLPVGTGGPMILGSTSNHQNRTRYTSNWLWTPWLASRPEATCDDSHVPDYQQERSLLLCLDRGVRYQFAPSDLGLADALGHHHEVWAPH